MRVRCIPVYSSYTPRFFYSPEYNILQHVALRPPAETMVGKAGCDAEWVPMTTHTSKIVRDTQGQLCQAQEHTYIAVWPPSSLMADPLRPNCVVIGRPLEPPTSLEGAASHNMRVGTGQVLHMPGQSYHNAYQACC